MNPSIVTSWWRRRPTMSSEAMALLASLFFVIVCNTPFWRALTASHERSTANTLFLLVCTGLFLTGAIWSLLLLTLNRWTAKPLLIALLIATSAAVYFMTQYGVFLDKSMLRNVFATDAAEASELLDWKMIPYLVGYGILPSVWLWRAQIPRRSWKHALRRRGVAFVLALVVAGAGFWAAQPELVPTMRAHPELRHLVTPVNYVASVASLVAVKTKSSHGVRMAIGTDARLSASPAGRKRRVFVVVVGETVRAANWGLSGYHRQTTPKLAARGVINFSDVTSCGTSTEVSVPCMFSVYGRHDYDEERIRHSESLLHVLQHGGVSVLWRDNQSGCKGVCDGVPFENLSESTNSELCGGGRCLDEILLRGLREKILSSDSDQLIVLHMLGNHGPAYYQRYPSDFRRWQPTCDTTDLANCSRDALLNTYDNAVGYSDHVLARIIDTLSGIGSRDTGMLYVSDHGESLGEYNMYLHGMPYAIAPSEQTKVPMIVWLSSGLSKSLRINTACLTRRASEPVSHDYLFHTVLGFFGVVSNVYDAAWDLAHGCRATPPTLARLRP